MTPAPSPQPERSIDRGPGPPRPGRPPLQPSAASVNWLLQNFATNTLGVDAAIGVSSDGLLMALSAAIDRSTADRFAAIVAGLKSLADGAARVLDRGRLAQVVVEMAGGYLVVAQISDGSALGVLTAPKCDLGLVAYEMTLLVERVGACLTPEIINELKNSLQV
jgi:predicted regulator of Ras-like GTPase activity (Roadblock/LC7/MglB family)